MRFLEMIRLRKELDRPAKPPRPYADGTVRIGDRVRAVVPSAGKPKNMQIKPVVGKVMGESRRGQCWVLCTTKGPMEYHKSFCHKVRASQVGKASRKLKAAAPERIYGDGELE